MQCKCVKYSEIGSEIQQHLKKRMLIPILGSGFTRNCESYAGKVPSGEDYIKYMIGEILKERKYDDTQKKKYENKQFSEISTIYHKVISIEEQRKYLRNNFTKVKLNGEKKKFLVCYVRCQAHKKCDKKKKAQMKIFRRIYKMDQ